MRLLAFALALALFVAAGIGAALDERLTPPTALRFADPALYEVVAAGALADEVLAFYVELGATDPTPGLAVGITQPIVEVYLDVGPGGAEEALPGSGMRMPPGTGWDVAVRITGDGAWAWLADEEGLVDLTAPLVLEAEAAGRTLTVRTPWALPDAAPRLFVVTGVYDPFADDGWRPLADTPSPWAFSSDTLALAAVDVWPGEAEAVARALETGVFPHRAAAAGDPSQLALWVTLMLVGLVIAVSGLWWRRAPLPAASATTAPATPDASGAPAGVAPAGEARSLAPPARAAPATPASTAAMALRRLKAEAWLIDDDEVESPSAARGEERTSPGMALVLAPRPSEEEGGGDAGTPASAERGH
jgi:hypothetical protein